MKHCKLFLALIVLMLMLVHDLTPSTKAQTQRSSRTCITKTSYRNDDLVFSHDSKYLVASWDENQGIAHLWNVETGKLLQAFAPARGTNANYQHWGRFAFSSDSKFLLSGDVNFPVIVLWDVPTGNSVYEIAPDGDTYGETPIKISVSPNNEYFVIWADGSTRVYNLKLGKQLYRLLAKSVNPVTFSADSKYILMPNDNHSEDQASFMVGDTSMGKKIHSIGTNAVYAGFVDHGRYIGTITPYKASFAYTLWSTSTYEEAGTFNLGDSVTDVTFSPDGMYLAVENNFSSLTLWDAVKGQTLHTFANYFGNGQVKFSEDSQYLLIGLVGYKERDDVPIARIWDVKRNKELSSFGIHDIAALAAISPNGKYLATGFENGELHLWNTFTDSEVYLEC